MTRPAAWHHLHPSQSALKQKWILTPPSALDPPPVSRLHISLSDDVKSKSAKQEFRTSSGVWELKCTDLLWFFLKHTWQRITVPDMMSFSICIICYILDVTGSEWSFYNHWQRACRRERVGNSLLKPLHGLITYLRSRITRGNMKTMKSSTAGSSDERIWC